MKVSNCGKHISIERDEMPETTGREGRVIVAKKRTNTERTNWFRIPHQKKQNHIYGTETRPPDSPRIAAAKLLSS